jgi:hypothetical protein
VDPSDFAGLANREDDWLPLGRQRLVVLEENDVLFVPPGLRLVQAWHTPVTCLTEQGLLCDDLSVLPIIESMLVGHEHQAAHEGRNAQQLSRMIRNIDCLIREQLDRFRKHMARDEFLARDFFKWWQTTIKCSGGDLGMFNSHRDVDRSLKTCPHMKWL